MKLRLVTSLICLALAALSAQFALASAMAATVTGTWSCCGSGGAAAQTWAITEGPGGTLSGSASDNSGTFSPISGKVSGSSVEIVTGPYIALPSYTATFVGTISGETMSGTWKSSASQEGTWTATRTAGGSETPKTPEPKTPEPTKGKRPSSISVECYYEFFSSQDTCTAQVSDAGVPPTTVPTGTVHFALTGPGSFISGPNCTLHASAEAPAVPFCSVVIRTPSSELPPLTAAYSGDAVHSGSEGHTQFLGAGLETPKVATKKSEPGSYPGEVELEVTVPTAKSELEATLAYQLGYWQNPPPADSALGKIFGSIPTLRNESEYPGWIDLRKGLEALAYDKPGSGRTKFEEWEDWNGKLMNAFTNASKYVNEHPDDPSAGETERKNLLALAASSNKLISLLSTLGTGPNAPAGHVKQSALRAAASAAKHKQAKSKVSVHRLAFTSIRDSRSGRVKLHLRINRRSLARLVGKRKQITVTAWVRALPPASVDPLRVPQIELEKLRLRR